MKVHVLHVPRATPFPSNSPVTELTRAFYRPEIEEKPKLWHCCCSHSILLGQQASLHLSAESNCWVLPAMEIKHQDWLPTFPQRPELNAKMFTAHSPQFLRMWKPVPGSSLTWIASTKAMKHLCN